MIGSGVQMTVKRRVLRMESSGLMPVCHKCGSDKTIEEPRKYNEETLNIAVCTICHEFDWIIPEGADEDEELLYDSSAWAEKQSIEILKENKKYFRISYSEPAKIVLAGHIDKFEEKITEFCDLLGSDLAFISQKEAGLLIYIHKVHLEGEQEE